MYLVRVTPPMNFTYFRSFLISLKNSGGGHKFSEFACLFFFTISVKCLSSKVVFRQSVVQPNLSQRFII